MRLILPKHIMDLLMNDAKTLQQSPQSLVVGILSTHYIQNESKYEKDNKDATEGNNNRERTILSLCTVKPLHSWGGYKVQINKNNS